MYYAYLKEKMEDLQGPPNISFADIVARPENNQGLEAAKFVEHTQNSSYPIVVSGKKAYEVLSDTELNKIVDLSGDDYIGNVEEEGGTYTVRYFQWTVMDTTCIVRITSLNPIGATYEGFTTLDYPTAVQQAKILENDTDFTISRSADEISAEKIYRINAQQAALSEKSILMSEFRTIVEDEEGYSLDNVVIDQMIDDSNVDEDNSDPYLIKIDSSGQYLEPQEIEYPVSPLYPGEAEAYVMQSKSFSISPDKVFVIGLAVSGGHIVEISNDGGSTWEEVTFVEGAFVSNELDIATSATGSFKLRIILFKGNYDYRPIISSWGFIWK